MKYWGIFSVSFVSENNLVSFYFFCVLLFDYQMLK